MKTSRTHVPGRGIDTHSLCYMSRKYGIVASCNCKDQVGTDGYTLWGGYWNQGYYPSKKNVFIPAQDAEGQIPVPVFRMLGSDPIYQYDDGLGTMGQGVLSLEPVWGCGGDPAWVQWFFHSLTDEPCLAFAYAQAGQENSFTWEGMAKGLTYQVEYLAKLVAQKKICVETLATTGNWFRTQFALTPATAVTATQDWKGENRKTVWYNSRYYRMNLLWEAEGFRIRDLHLFDQEYTEPYLDAPLLSSKCLYDTLPVVDGFHWSQKGDLAGIRLVALDGTGERVLDVGAPRISESAGSELLVSCPVTPQGTLDIRCMEGQVVFKLSGMPESGKYALALTWSQTSTVPFEHVEPAALNCLHRGFHYRVACRQGHFERGPAERNSILIVPDGETVILNFVRPG